LPTSTHNDSRVAWTSRAWRPISSCTYPDGRWQPSRRSFRRLSGTIVRRTPLRRVLKPQERQPRHYLLDDRPTESTRSDWLLGAFPFMRREMLEELGGLDEGCSRAD
jgi:hypothetical protein